MKFDKSSSAIAVKHQKFAHNFQSPTCLDVFPTSINVASVLLEDNNLLYVISSNFLATIAQLLTASTTSC